MNRARNKGLSVLVLTMLLVVAISMGLGSAQAAEPVRKEVVGGHSSLMDQVENPPSDPQPAYTVNQPSVRTENHEAVGGVVLGEYPQAVENGEHTVMYAANPDFAVQSVTVTNLSTGDVLTVEAPDAEACVIRGIESDIDVEVTFVFVGKVRVTARGAEVTGITQSLEDAGTYSVTYQPADPDAYVFEKAEIVGESDERTAIENADEHGLTLTGVTGPTDVVVTFAKKEAKYQVFAYLPQLAPNEDVYDEEPRIEEYAAIGDEIVIDPASFDIPGFSFDEDHEKNVLSAEVAADGSTRLALYFVRDDFTLTFQVRPDSPVMAGEVLGTETYAYQEIVTLPEPPEIDVDGLVLFGWFQDTDGIPTEPGSTFSMPAQDVTARTKAESVEVPVLQLCVNSKEKMPYDEYGFDLELLKCKLIYDTDKPPYTADQLEVTGWTLTVVRNDTKEIVTPGPNGRYMLDVGEYRLQFDIENVVVKWDGVVLRGKNEKNEDVSDIMVEKCYNNLIEITRIPKEVPPNTYVHNNDVVYDGTEYSVIIPAQYQGLEYYYSTNYRPGSNGEGATWVSSSAFDAATGASTGGVSGGGHIKSSVGFGQENGWPVYVKFMDIPNNNYINICEGRVVIRQRPVEVRALDDEKVYNNKPYNETGEWEFAYGTPEYTQKLQIGAFSAVDKKGLLSGHILSAIVVESAQIDGARPVQVQADGYAGNLQPSVTRFDIQPADGVDNDLYKNYSVSPISGKFTIHPRPFTVTAEDKTVPYTGSTYTDEKGLSFTAGSGERWPILAVKDVDGLIDGHRLAEVNITSIIDSTVKMRPVNVGEYENNLLPGPLADSSWKIIVMDGKGNDVTHNYTDSPGLVSGKLTITPRERYELEVEGGEKVYDDTPIGVIIKNKPDDATKVEYKTGDGEWSEEEITQTIPGDKEVWVRVTTGNEVIVGKGTIKVTKRPLVIKAENQTFFYNGRPFNGTGSKVYTADYEQGVSVSHTTENAGLVAGEIGTDGIRGPGHSIQRVAVYSQKKYFNVNQTPQKGAPYEDDMAVNPDRNSLIIVNAQKKDVTDYYQITYETGDLTIKPRRVFLSFKDPVKSKDWNGVRDPLPDWEVLVHSNNVPDGGLIEGEKLVYGKTFQQGDYPDVGVYPATITHNEADNPNYILEVLPPEASMTVYGRVTYNTRYPQGYPKNKTMSDASYLDPVQYLRGQDVRRYTHAEIAALEPGFVATGLTFLGWEQDGNTFDGGSRFNMGAHSVQLYAKWRVNEYKLTVQHRVEGQPNEKVADDEVFTDLQYAAYYNVSAKSHAEYTALETHVEGNMPDGDLTRTIYYRPKGPVDPDRYTLTVEHLLLDDPQTRIAEDTVRTGLREGDAYNEAPVSHDQYEAVTAGAVGVMPDGNLTVQIYYRPKTPPVPDPTYTLTVQHRLKSNPEVKIVEDMVFAGMKEGDEYNVSAVWRVNYTPDKDRVQGTMPGEDKVEIILYTPDGPGPGDDEYTLTVKHRLISNPNVYVKGDTVQKLKEGDPYREDAILHVNYEALISHVEGTMPGHDYVEYIYYREKDPTKPNPEKHTLTVQHRLESNPSTKVFEDMRFTLAEGDTYDVAALSHPSYVAIVARVQGTMPNGDKVETILYRPIDPPGPGDEEYTLTVKHRLISDPNVYIKGDAVQKLKEGDPYREDAILHVNYEALISHVEGTMPGHDHVEYIYYREKDPTKPNPEKHTLTVQHRLESNPSTKVFEDMRFTLAEGDDYDVAALSHPSYTAIVARVQGTMPNGDKVETILYRPTNPPGPGDNEYTLTVKHRLISNPNVHIKADTVQKLKEGDPYREDAILHVSYEALTSHVEGTMPGHDHVAYIYYREKDPTKPNPEKHTLTVQHRLEGNPSTKVFEDMVFTLAEGDTYDVSALPHPSYTAVTARVQGTMPNGDKVETIYYRLNDPTPGGEAHTLTVEHLLVSNPSVRIANNTVRNGLKAGDTYDVPAVAHNDYTPIRASAAGVMPDKDHVDQIYYQANEDPENPDKRYVLVVRHRLLDNPSAKVAADTVVTNLREGDAYNVPAVLHASYTALTSGESGTMPGSDLVLTIYYRAKSTTPDPSNNKYVLTVQHRVQGDVSRKVAEDTVIKNLEYGSGYFVSAVQHASYTALTASVSGSMPNNDLTLTIYYKAKTSGGGTGTGTGSGSGSGSKATPVPTKVPSANPTPVVTLKPQPAPTPVLETIYDQDVPLGNIASPNVGECYE